MRLLAWAYVPSPITIGQGDRARLTWSREEIFCCKRECRKAGSSDLDEGARNAKNCCLPGFDSSNWKSQELYQIHMGLPPNYDLEGKDKHFLKPIESIGDGCPGGWYRCGFVRSIHKYRRNGIENRQENLLLKRTKDPLIIEAIDYLEDQEVQSYNDFMEIRNSD